MFDSNNTCYYAIQHIEGGSWRMPTKDGWEELKNNCEMALYYIRALMTTGERPETMLSPNTTTDYNKLRKANCLNLSELEVTKLK